MSSLSTPVKKPKTIVDFLNDKDTTKKFQAVLSGYITPEKMLRLCYTALRKTPRLMECDPHTVFGAMMTAASLDLEPNTVMQEAFLIPYAKNVPLLNEKGEVVTDAKGKWQWTKTYECNFQIGYRGFINLAYRSPKLVKLEAEAIHKNDIFEHQKGSDSFLKYVKKLSDRGDLIGAFCYIKARNEFGGDADLSTILPLDEVNKIRNKSETFRTLTRNVENAENDKAKAKAAQLLAETPWVMWEDDMVAKSAIKKAIKQFPLIRTLANAANIDSNAEDGSLDLAAMSDVDMVRSVKEGEDMPMIEHQHTETMPDITGPAKGEKVAVAAHDKETGEIIEKKAQPLPEEKEQKKPEPVASGLNFGD